jgi:hypothetical protein
MRRILLALSASTLLAAASFLTGCGDDDASTPSDANVGSKAGDTAPVSGGLKSPSGWPSAAERRLAPDREPSPFSAQQIARACGPQSKRVFRFVMGGAEPSYKLWTFIEQTEAGCTFLQTDCDEHGLETGEPSPTNVTWQQLQSHASWPATDVTASEAKMKVPAGTYECMHYVIKRKNAQGVGEDKFWFAWDLPGPPVRMERSAGGQVKVTMTLMKVEGVAAN